MPVSETSDTALPRPCAFSSFVRAAAFARPVSADTDASNSEALAADEATAAEADATAEEAAEASAEGGVPENDAVTGGEGRGLTEAAAVPLPPPPPHATSARLPAAASTAPVRAPLPRYRRGRPPSDTPLTMAPIPFRS
ncbi:hypothetical protein GCM10010339_15850 [Streptomyces alanosinicus]|uniref:Uncharacterized protein n=1 Tax=Streptomyces alanosinicus TaxID=68171 RepID=A0A918YFU8_9ACTN|nr:hypothetical protein GCM10010339_15850 [Streptomyces alanosinicus]